MSLVSNQDLYAIKPVICKLNLTSLYGFVKDLLRQGVGRGIITGGI
jgi:hypothetical protein